MDSRTKFKKEDYVMCEYDGELLSAKILEVLQGEYRVEMYIDTLDNEVRLMQEMIVRESQLHPVQIAIVANKRAPIGNAAPASDLS